MTDQPIAAATTGARGLPVSINQAQTLEQQMARAETRIANLTGKLQRQKDKDAPAERIAETEAAITQWKRKLKAARVLAGLED
jgi:transcription elongation GreA/GreB family factor